MEEVASFSPLKVSITQVGGDGLRVITRNESVQINKQINIEDTDENYELASRFRWPNSDLEMSLLKISESKPELTWKRYFYIMQRKHEEWTGPVRKMTRVMLFSIKNSRDRSGKRVRTTVDKQEYTLRSLGVNELFAAVLRTTPDAPPKICFRALTNIEQTRWIETDAAVENLQTAYLWMNELYIVDGSLLRVYSFTDEALELRAEAELAERAPSDTPVQCTAIRVNKHFVVIAARGEGIFVARRGPGVPHIAVVPCEVSTLSLDSVMICAGLLDGTTHYFKIAHDESEQIAVLPVAQDSLMREWRTDTGRAVKMQPEEVWNLSLSGPRTAVSSQTNFIMYDRNPESYRLCAMNDLGTVIAMATFGELVAIVNAEWNLALIEFASGRAFYTTRSAAELAGDSEPDAGRQILSFGPKAITLLLPNGALFMLRLGNK